MLLHAILLNLSCDCSSLTPLYHVLRWNASLCPSSQGFPSLCWRENGPGLPVLWDSEFMDLGVQLHKKERTIALVISELPPQPNIGWFWSSSSVREVSIHQGQGQRWKRKQEKVTTPALNRFSRLGMGMTSQTPESFPSLCQSMQWHMFEQSIASWVQVGTAQSLALRRLPG